jgi:site-specific DNA recombinase
MARPTTRQPALRAALYARFSSDVQKDRSIDDQFADLEKAATRFGFKLDKRHYYCDRAQSATTLFDRPGLTRELLGASRRGEFDVVLVEATDRLSRSKADLFWLADRFEFDKVKIFTPGNGEVSDMQLTFDSHTNADMVKKLAIRVKRGHDGIAREGKIAGALSYGYDTVPGKPGERTINRKEAAVVRRIYAEYASGVTPRQIVAGLARDKIPSPSGAPFWNHQVIVGGLRKRGLIHNRLYVGEYVKNRYYNVKNPANGKRVTRKADESDLIVAKVPHMRIVEQALWDTAHRVREVRGFEKFGQSGYVRRPVLARKEYLLSGLLKCGECQGAMTVTASSRVGQRIACSTATYRKTCTHTKSYDLGRITSEAIKKADEELAHPDAFRERMKAKVLRRAQLTKEKNSERQEVQKALDRVNLSIARLVDAIADSDQPLGELKNKIASREIERVALVERQRLLGAADNVITLPDHAVTKYTKDVKTLVSVLRRDTDDPAGRLGFRNLIDCITVYPTPKGMPYDLGMYARLSGYGGIDVFPATRSHQEILEAEGFSSRIGPGGTASLHPR